MTDFNKGKLEKCVSDILYLDVNSNYAGAMTEPLPYGKFVKLTEESATRILNKIKKKIKLIFKIPT